MAALINKLFKDTLDLVTLYNTNLRFKTAFDRTVNQPGAIFRFRPVKLYIKVLASFLPPYRDYYSRFKTDPNSAQELLAIYYRNRHGELAQLEQAASNPRAKVFTDEEHRQIEEIDRRPHADTAQKVDRINEYDRVVEQVEKREERQQPAQKAKEPLPIKLGRARQLYQERQQAPQLPPQTRPRQTTMGSERLRLIAARLRTITSSQPVQNLTSHSKIVGRRLAIGTLRGVGSLVGGMGSRLLTGGGPRGVTIAARGGGAVAGAAARGVVAAGGALGGLIVAGGWISAIVIGVIALIAVLAWFILSFGPPTIGFPGPPTTPGGSEIAHCLFRREDRRPSDEKFQSSQLLSYFSEVAQKTTVPAQILAAIARVEVPSSTSQTDASLASWGCPKNADTLATGIMQIVPHYSHRTDAICLSCIEQGASYLGKAVDQLTEADYCDHRSNTFLGAGFILKKLQALGYGDGTKWDPAWTSNKAVIDTMVASFYGCLGYPSCNDGPFNYGNDVWFGVSSCTPQPPAPAPVTDPGLFGLIVSCPLGDSTITTCGTYRFPSGNNCGHGKPPEYASCDPNIYAECGPVDDTGYRQHGEFLKKSIDVITTDLDPHGEPDSGNKPVKLPFISNQSVSWTRLTDPVALNAGLWGYKFIYATQLEGKTILLDLSHLNSKLTNRGSNLLSGTEIGTLFLSGRWGSAHLHTGIKVDGVPIEAQQEARMCL